LFCHYFSTLSSRVLPLLFNLVIPTEASRTLRCAVEGPAVALAFAFACFLYCHLLFNFVIPTEASRTLRCAVEGPAVALAFAFASGVGAGFSLHMNAQRIRGFSP
jgi:hypothetical protein